MAINSSQSFDFKSISDFQIEAPHMKTEALLNKGHMTVGGKRYNVSLSADNKISVSRDQTANKAGRFFNGMSDLFKRRVGDDASSSRSHRMENTLNHRRDIEERSSSLPSTPKPTPRHKPASVPLERLKLTREDFSRQELERASYHGETPSEALAETAYKRYTENNRPTAPLRRAQSDPTPAQAKPEKSDNRTFNYFMQQENERASYHGETPRQANAEEAFLQHLRSQQPTRRQNARPQAHSYTTAPKPSAANNHTSEMNRVQSELDSARYYGTTPNVSKFEQQMYEASNQRPVKTESEGRRRHQSAPADFQNASSRRTRRPEQNTVQSPQSGRGAAVGQTQLESNIRSKMSQLPPQEQRSFDRTLKLFKRAAQTEGMDDLGKRETLKYIDDLISMPAAKRNSEMQGLQGFLQDIISGKREL